tara:strand:+ start:304 stop:894 length:591 start_codon:yes stop_codon:yes gene_type:complete
MSDIKQTIQDFYKVAQTRDFARDFQFRVLDVSNKGTPVFDETDLVYATAVELPGKTIATKDVPYNGFNFRIPGTVSYNNSDAFTIDFYCDATTTARVAMENWITETYDDRTTTGDGILHDDSRVTLVQLDSNFEPMRTYKLHGVFPTDCGNIAYSMSGDGEVATVTVTMAYQFFRRDETLGKVGNAIGKLAGALAP